MPRWIPSPSLNRTAPVAGAKIAPAGTAGYEAVVATFAQRLWQLLAGSVTTGSNALEGGSSPAQSQPHGLAPTESEEDKRRLDNARTAWAEGFSARVETMRAILSSNVAGDSPTPLMVGDE